ncbi:cobalt/nickel transport system ATP-binding protein [Cricetibacter osteomyelitidis]|uniref:Cobalt/nickel transport system ATP-binding protein n=1 Tax=Cricetibacter osteomyelitidis TaxID=1521931 RepID=A0A4R2T3Z7_9PAST|nr:energy-coupling factor ABC transporter ATP-binding protein [Cricetibacter osteomyelitidis]TCP97707.1 cobalt/nickel transport system ATP-binding protein [Cricetibacter osteomyelitidis]
MKIISVNNLSIQRDDRPVIHDLSFSMQEQERVFLHGEIGTGKSTLLHALLGFVPIHRGEIKLFDQRCHTEQDFTPFRGSQIGLLFQNPDDQLFGPTVLDDVAFGPQNQGKTEREAKEIAYQHLVQLGIEHLQDRPVNLLSGGEKNFTALAGVLAMRPKILLLDEPTNGLDSKNIAKLTALLQQLELPMLVACHDLAFSATLADRVIDLPALH